MVDLKYDMEHLAEEVDRHPGDVPVDAIISRGRRRRRRRSLAAGTSVLAAVGLVASVAVSLPASDSPGVEVLGQPGDATGSQWGTVATGLPGATNDARSWVASDGSIVVYGGTRGVDGPPESGGMIIDPSTGDVIEIPDPQIEASPARGAEFSADRLLVFGGLDGSPAGAMFDVLEQAWTSIPAAPMGNISPSVLAWDGSTLVVGDTSRITAVENEGQYGNLLLWKWTVGADSWTELAETPVDAGRIETSFSDGRLAVWTNPNEPDPETGESIIGGLFTRDAEQRESRLAVLDIAAEMWTVAPRDEVPNVGDGDEADIAWSQGQIVVAPLPAVGTGAVSGPNYTPVPLNLPAPATWDPDTGTWGEVEPLPEDLQETRLRYRQNNNHIAGPQQPLQAEVRDELVAVLLPDGTWTEPVDADRALQVGDNLVALTGLTRESTDLRATEWDGQVWQPIAEQDLGMRRFAATATTDGSLYVTGGWSVRFNLFPDSVRETIRLTVEP